MGKILKYFELPLEEKPDWTWRDYLVFVIESLYTTVFPFVAGMLLIYQQKPIWIFMLILPIYFRLNLQKDKKRPKRIYFKE